MAALTASPANATVDDFPTIEEMATVLPGLAGATVFHHDTEAELEGRWQAERDGRVRYCYARTIGTRRGETLEYGDTEYYLDSYPLTFGMYDLGTPKRAAKQMRRMRTGFASCEGSSEQDDGQRVRMKRFDAASLSRSFLAYTTTGGYNEGSVVLVRRRDLILTTRSQDRRSGVTAEQQSAISAMALLLSSSSRG